MHHQLVSNKESSVPSLICVDIDGVPAIDYNHPVEISSVQGPLSLRSSPSPAVAGDPISILRTSSPCALERTLTVASLGAGLPCFQTENVLIPCSLLPHYVGRGLHLLWYHIILELSGKD